MTMKTALLKLMADNDHDPTGRQIAVLLEICESDSKTCTVRGLSGRLGFSKPVITRAADRLEIEQWGKRMPDPLDRRSVLIVPTQRGRALVKAFLVECGK